MAEVPRVGLKNLWVGGDRLLLKAVCSDLESQDDRGMCSMFDSYYGHSASKAGEWEPLREHLKAVSEKAREFAAAFGATEEASMVGLLHDLGKYGDLFQKRIRGEAEAVDHWSSGAWAALDRYQQHGIAGALSIQGHHVGLQQASKDSLSLLEPGRLAKDHPLGMRLAEPDVSLLLRRLQSDDLKIPEAKLLGESLYNRSNDLYTSEMLNIRMLYSCLVDADFLETEAHFKSPREPAPKLNASRDLEMLRIYLDDLATKSEASKDVIRLRKDLLDSCWETANLPPGIFTLTAPTGSGKTLSMLAFALRHAALHGLRRIVVVIPYLSIIEQTAKEYREVFTPYPEEKIHRYLVEQHSLAGTRGKENDNTGNEPEDSVVHAGQLVDNWDAPIILTTSVQFLESFFANRSSVCRKLHRLSKSVVLFDEVQTLPAGLVVPTLGALSHLAKRFGSTVVFSTATQPAFSHLDKEIVKHSAQGWRPREMVEKNLNLFSRAKRTEVFWPLDLASKSSWDQIAEEINTTDCRQALCIVNLKAHALTLFDKLNSTETEGLLHLSTNMCPAHRIEVLSRAKSLLDDGKACRLISTQCIEAGVDIDFPVVYRAFAPLDSIVQAAGRCNRKGTRESGQVHIFIPEDERYPDGAYRQAASVTRVLLARARHGKQGLDINSTRFFEEYYRELYDLAEPQNKNPELLKAIKCRDFAKVARLYRVIPQDSINVLVPYQQTKYEKLCAAAKRNGLSKKWVSAARQYAIGMYRPDRNDPTWAYLDPVKVSGRPDAAETEWYIYLAMDHYSEQVGLNPPEPTGYFIG